LNYFFLSQIKICADNYLKKIKQSAKDNIHILKSSAEQIDSENDTYDFVFLSLVCCSVKDVNLTLSEIKRVLKPDGKFIFLEHVAAQTGTSRRKWQGRLNGIWRLLAGNCHLNRETEKSIIEAGFSIEHIKRESLRKAPSIVRPTIRGIASLTQEWFFYKFHFLFTFKSLSLTKTI